MVVIKRLYRDRDIRAYDVVKLLSKEGGTILHIEFWKLKRDDDFIDPEHEGNLFISIPGLPGNYGELINELDYGLEEFRLHPQFKDASVFGLSPYNRNFIYASADPGKQTFTGFYGFLHAQSRYVAVIFPDTESTFDDCIISVPYFEDHDTFIIHNGEERRIDSVPLDKLNRQHLPVMDFMFPSVKISGDSSMGVDDEIQLTLSVGDGPFKLGSMFNIIVQSDNGYLPKRHFSVEEGSSISLKVRSTGLDIGDTITVKVGTSQFAQMSTHRITIE